MAKYNSYVTNAKKCGPGQLKVKRRGYTRAGKRVKATTYCAPDRGRPGRGPKTIPTPRKGSLGGPGYTKKTAEARHRELRKHLRDHGYASTVAAIQSRINLGRRTMSARALRVFEADKKWLQRTVGRNPRRNARSTRRWRVKGVTRQGLMKIPGVRSAKRVDRGVYEIVVDDDVEVVFWAGELELLGTFCDVKAGVCEKVARDEDGLIGPSAKFRLKDVFSGLSTNRNAKTMAKKRNKKGSSAGLRKARAIRGAMALGVSKTKANELYDAGKLTATGRPKAGARGMPADMKEALGPKKKRKKATKKKAKKRTKKKTTRKGRPAKLTKKQRASKRRPRPGTKTRKKICKKRLTKEGKRRAGLARRRGEGKQLAQVRWCRNFMNLKVAEKDLGLV